jgi:hypothetical protein
MNTNPDISAIRAAFAVVQATYQEETDLEAALAAVAERRNAAVMALATAMGDATKLRHPADGRELTIVLEGKDGRGAFIRGMKPTKSTKKAAPVIDLG